MSDQLAEAKHESIAIFVIAAAQFVNVVDFMMVMPLGPDFAKALGIRVSHMGVMSGAYTLAAAFSGLICSFFIDRIGRRTALVWAIVGLAVGTGAAAFAVDFHTLLLARVLAGIFGGPTTSIGLAIIGDIIPHERRGAAIGKVMMGFSAASIFGVPIGLEIANMGGWNAPFLVVGLCAAVMALLARLSLPEMKGHIVQVKSGFANLPFKSLIRQLPVWTSYSLLACVMMSGFLIFPNIAGFIQFNLGFPREDMGRLYFIGGMASLLVMVFCGKLVDRFGSLPWFILGSFGFIIALFFGMYQSPPLINVYGLFVSFMVFGTLRNISMQTLASKVPLPAERAGFMSLQSAVQHTAMSVGGILSSRLLSTGDHGELIGIESIVMTSTVMVILGAFLVVILAGQVKAHEH